MRLVATAKVGGMVGSRERHMILDISYGATLGGHKVLCGTGASLFSVFPGETLACQNIYESDSGRDSR